MSTDAVLDVDIALPSLKRCTKCKVEQVIADFPLRQGRPGSWCRTCRRWNSARWAANNPEKRRASDQARQLTPEQLDRKRESTAAWHRKHPEVAVQSVHRRRALRHQTPVGERYTRDEVFERDGWVCQLCLHPVDPGLLGGNRFDPWYPTVDHVIPITRGGADSIENVQLAHRICNARKSSSLQSVA